MNIENGLEEPMKEISAFNGVCLSLVERIKLETTLDQLKSDIKCDEMQFWGIIYGAEKDYYIAKALYYKGYPQFPKKKYFFCSSSNFIFSELPSLYSHQIPNFHKFNTYFIGNPDIILEKYDSGNAANFDEENEGDSFKPKIKKKNMTETDRLSFVVRAIDRDCSVVPVGGFKMMPINELRRNDLFEGLNSEDLDKKEKYVHFRPVENQEKKDKIAMGKDNEELKKENEALKNKLEKEKEKEKENEELSLGKFAEPVILQQGQKFILTINDIQGDINKASVSHKGIVKDLKPGIIVLIDDGLLS